MEILLPFLVRFTAIVLAHKIALYWLSESNTAQQLNATTHSALLIFTLVLVTILILLNCRICVKALDKAQAEDEKKAREQHDGTD